MKFSIVANTKQENIREILKKVIGFVEDFELDKVTAKFPGLSGVEIKDLSGEVIISLGGDGTILQAMIHQSSRTQSRGKSGYVQGAH